MSKTNRLSRCAAELLAVILAGPRADIPHGFETRGDPDAAATSRRNVLRVLVRHGYTPSAFYREMRERARPSFTIGLGLGPLPPLDLPPQEELREVVMALLEDDNFPARFSSLEVIPDPSCDAAAVRATIGGETYEWLYHADTVELEEVEFTTWPPERRYG